MAIQKDLVVQGWIPVRIASKHDEAEDVVVLELVSVSGVDLPAFTAGSHVDVEIAPGLVRQYSLCNAPDSSKHYRIGVLKEPNSRGGSIAVHQNLQVGHEIRISAPRNLFALDPSAKRVKLLAGGIGITPILAMAEHLLRQDVPFSMNYCCRAEGKAAFKNYLSTPPFSSMVSFHFDEGGVRLNPATDIGTWSEGAHLYVCGPGGFIDFVLGSARALGWPESSIHREYFVAPLVDTSDDTAFEVRVASSGQTVRVCADQTIVEALAGIGIQVEMSCEQGICGTCLTRVLEGEPEHRDMFLTNEEHVLNNQMTLCCSRSKSKLLVLDL
jgi:vanillate O-demethylase ferredoxin subunit